MEVAAPRESNSLYYLRALINPYPHGVCAANEGCNYYHPMFFTHDRAWEEFFCVCIQLLNKTWKEMRATAEDFNKVRGPHRTRLKNVFL